MSLGTDLLSTQSASDWSTNRSELAFLIKSMLSEVRTCLPVEVVAVTNSGTDAAIGYVDIRPLVGQLDGSGNVIDHGVIHNAPYSRLQGGSNAIILDPQVGDIGLAAFCDRDIGVVKATQKTGAPGSKRRHDMSDAVYLMTIMGGIPSQYIQFNSGGISIVTPGNVLVTAGGNASVTAIGSATITAASAIIKAGSIVLKNAGTALYSLLNATLLTWLNSHVHSNGNGGANTGAPTTTPASSVQTSVVQAE